MCEQWAASEEDGLKDLLVNRGQLTGHKAFVEMWCNHGFSEVVLEMEQEMDIGNKKVSKNLSHSFRIGAVLNCDAARRLHPPLSKLKTLTCSHSALITD